MQKKQTIKKEMTKAEVLQKLTALCAKSEHCQYDMLTKMSAWNVPETMQAEVLAYLISERYVDDERYTRAFIRSKATYNRWGRRKIEQALRMKRVGEDVYKPLLDEVCSAEDYEKTLLPLLQTKAKSVKGNSEYEIRGKLIRFALSRGFDYDVIERVIEKL